MTKNLEIRTAGELGQRVATLADVSELVGAALSLDGLILREADLGPDFFRLGSGVAGELFQKLVNYRIFTALVVPDFAAHGERFAELAHEHARHPQVRFVTSEAAARDWLGRQGAE
ncbi:DUF4180 domain-containing protein [Deinococcus irradiatisoli]|uniref:DUF4180 domain-containing protein n=1 Tax=Deinococcus irradiatisoli TaxID=2202254 RepID=A0A2Z3JR30_9DEIO|nr:DUF4180 domain-containing protein [Deinococcus irradiatisoli]AWN23274.1 DUF4180 domain-containing protein [Deinococcus irradiatisoli]